MAVNEELNLMAGQGEQSAFGQRHSKAPIKFTGKGSVFSRRINLLSSHIIPRSSHDSSGLAMSNRLRVTFFLAPALMLCLGLWASLNERPLGAADNENVVPERAPLQGSKFVGSPEPPPPYRTVNAFPRLKFDQPLHVTQMPGTNRLVVCEQKGKIFSFPNDKAVTSADLLFDIKDVEKSFADTPCSNGLDNLYAIAFHPEFEKNRLCYVCYVLRPKEGRNLENGSRIVRFRVTDEQPPRIDAASQEIILTFLQGGHNGCDLQFGPDGYLYISTGDAAPPNPPDPELVGQDVTNLLSAVLRIDVDRPDKGQRYGVPKDNPFVGMEIDGKPARGEIWAYGFRNPWRMGFDRKTGELWLGDVGWELWEMVHKIEKGGNYGWSIVEARQSVHANAPIGPTPIRPPVIELPHTLAASVTGGFIYRGKKFPELDGQYIFGDWETRRIWAAQINGDRLIQMDELVEPSLRVVAFGEDRDGELFIADHDGGGIHTLEKNENKPTNTDFPKTLSQSGLFRSVADHEMVAGVYKFEPNARMWQDHSQAEYWIALPGDSAVTDYADKRPIPGHVNWHRFGLHYPENAVLLKTISIPTEPNDLSKKRRLETQILHWDGDSWRPYTYAWREDQSDADLVPAEGSEITLKIPDPRHATGTREQVWHYASRSQCMQCHNVWTEYSMAFNIEQLNRADPELGSINQLSKLAQLGLIRRIDKQDIELPPYDENDCAKARRLTDPTDDKSPLVDRALSYLHVNCGHCHRFGGGGSVDIELLAWPDRKGMEPIDRHPKQGNFDLPDAKVIASGRPDGSVVLFRLAKFGKGRMPHMGSEFADEYGVRLIHDWIASLSQDDNGEKSQSAQPLGHLGMTDAEKFLENPASALTLAARLAHPETDSHARQTVLAAVAKMEPGHARDLFDGYLPQTGERKLGPNPRQSVVLSRQGDAGRGKRLFFAEAMQCTKCHKVDNQGVDVGPDLTKALSNHTPESLLESILEPSRRINPDYQPYLLKTVDGRVATGLLISRNDKEVILKDAQGKELKFDGEDVEAIQPSRESLMPSGLLANITAQEAADLLAYLLSIRQNAEE